MICIHFLKKNYYQWHYYNIKIFRSFRGKTLDPKTDKMATNSCPPIRSITTWGIMTYLILFLSATVGYGFQTAGKPTIDKTCLAQKHRTFSLYMENDALLGNGTDGQYTNGLKLSWSRYGLSELPEDASVHKWFYPIIRYIGMDAPAEADKALTFSIGQNIYTPNEIEKKELIKDDRPYAGITYFEMGFHKKHSHRMHTVGIIGGVVGPSSYADEIQTVSHEVLNNDMPRGWKNQLEDEPVLALVYDYKQKLLAANLNQGWGGDIIFHTGGCLGNALTCYQAGISLRGGWNVPDDCGNFPIQPATCFNAETARITCSHPNMLGCHFFLSLSAKAVLQDIFLDGNTFRDSHRVDKKPLVGSAMTGIGITTGRMKIVCSIVWKTKSFNHQHDPETFGSIDIAFQY